ncbi:ABC transporter ATP-binding protein [Paenibacillus hamazuiensis]|uniref:ABC transporter ATP-binding protein n=1 Tax=Paenibacillus hamazuiensis TaxID=2936508 RepID=UPI00200C2A0F|nr:ABC transporter ATP-binding protein [Paenibacillus hamazuiensis]
MHFLKKYARKYGGRFSLAVFFLTLEALADLLQPTIMSKIVDVGVANSDLHFVLRMGGLMLLITAMGAVAASMRNILATLVSQAFGAELRGDLFKKIQSLTFESIDKFERASLVTRLTNDVTQVQNFMNGLMRIFVKAPLICIGSLIMATRLDPQLAIVLAVVVPIVALLIIFNLKLGFPLFINVQRALDRVNGAMREYLSGVRVVKAFNRFDFEVDKFNKTNEEYQSRTIRAMRTMAVFNPAIMLTVNFGIIAVIWLGGLGVSRGDMQVGHIIAFINYMTQILFSLMMISMVFNMFIRAKASAGRIGEVFEQSNDMTWKENAGVGTAVKGRVDFENVTFSYEGTSGLPAVKNVNLTVLPGETVGIIGSTGSGKSSLVSLIPRFYDAVSGSVKVDGVDVRDVDPKILREKIALVPQKTVLFTGTVTENIRWGKEDASAEEIEAAARMAEAHDFIASFPEGYNTMLGQRGVNFSGGQKQRVSIARALVRRPEILILDDCTSAVDVATEARIKEALKTYAKDLTCILIAQRITSVMDADKIVVMDNGEIVGIGKHHELMRSCLVYQEIFQSQVGKELQKDVTA